MMLLLTTAAALLMAWLLTGLMRRYALRSQLLDIPNERSSHTAPTPRGGGVAIVATFLAATAASAAWAGLPGGLAAAVLGAGTLVALLGYVDDRRSLPARVRLAGHMAAAAWVLGWVGPISPVPIFGVAVDLPWLSLALCWVFIVWMINLFNFMDGIDGLAGAEAAATALGGAFLWWWIQPAGAWGLSVLFAASALGFLIWNFPPARIFMGDAGSGFIGLCLATLALWSARGQPLLFWAWLILVGGFMVDATTTLVRRHRRGERVHEPHRNHAYQYASRQLGAHRPVTLAMITINVVWLFPLGLAVASGRLDGALGVLIAYAPLVALALRYKAGDRAGQGS